MARQLLRVVSVLRPHGVRIRWARPLLLALLAGVLSVGAQPNIATKPTSGWAWPMVPHPRVLRLFDPPAHPWLAGHRGVDLAAAEGSVIRAPAAGIIVFAGTVVDRQVLTVRHADGLLSSLEPVASTLPAGTPVTRSEIIGRLHGVGHCPVSCLHWGVRDGPESYLDPLSFLLDRRPSVLLPLG